MEGESKPSEETFLVSGIYRVPNSNAFFIDPVRMLNRSYTQFKVSPSSYYSRFFESKQSGGESTLFSNLKKRERKPKKLSHTLNEKEQVAEQRHQEVRPLLLKAHESFVRAADFPAIMSQLRSDFSSALELSDRDEHSFIEIERVWQATLCEITLNFSFSELKNESDNRENQNSEKRVLPLFNNFVINDKRDEVEAEFLNRGYVLPRESSFYMSNFGQIHNLIPAESDSGFNLIVIDPPWENGSARKKSMYPTLPNWHFLFLPIKQLSHRNGALVALWVTNREKLHNFVEKELFPAWGVRYLVTIYWLKVKADGSLIGDLDLFHHWPYECIMLGYCGGKEYLTDLEYPSELWNNMDKCVIISIPGDYSRKPPIGELLLDHVPGVKPARCIELFAREIVAGWVAWGNEHFRFQDLRYFQRTFECISYARACHLVAIC